MLAKFGTYTYKMRLPDDPMGSIFMIRVLLILQEILHFQVKMSYQTASYTIILLG